jgi:single-stranded-DNA-specific exonuclease
MNNITRWLVAPALTEQANASLSAFPPVLRQLLFNRGYVTEQDARLFLDAQIGFDPDPFRMKGMAPAVERLLQAVDGGEAIAVYGDYDVDGVTATALLVQVLQSLGGKVSPYIPNRFDEGYGLNNEALTSLHEQGIRVIVTVDCGIRSTAEVIHARAAGLDLILTDHHQPGSDLPDALVVINPKQAGDEYPDKDLAGVGVAYKLAEALLQTRPIEIDRTRLLDLVALGTVADLAPLTGENRSLVRSGLAQMRQTRRQGLFSLANVAGVAPATLNATHIGFMLGPRLNAAGRLESALAAYELLTTTELARAGQLAQKLDVQNRERQALTRKIQGEAEAIALADNPEAFLMFAVHPDFNSGVVGLAAGRLVEIYYRPAVVGQISGETTRCSCRSIPEFHITEALDRCADLLVRYGGHAAAAGFTVRNENLAALKARLLELATEKLKSQDLRQTLRADMELPLTELRFEMLKQLEALQPTGYGNPEAVFVTRNARVQGSRTVGAENKHLKLTVTDGRITFDVIGFRLGHLQPGLPAKVDLLYTFESNEYNGRTSLQLNLKDLKPAGQPD